jgi:hypothetical protein
MEVFADMDHSEAIRLMAAEKYLLDELDAELREGFEEHFFECQECALDVRSGTAFFEHSKVLLARPAMDPLREFVPVPSPVPRPGPRWLRPVLLVPIFAVLLAVIGYQNLITFPKMTGSLAAGKSPELLASASLINVTRGNGNQPVVAARSGQPFLLYVDVTPDSRFSSYQAELLGPAGNSEWSLAIPAEKAKDTLPIRVPPPRDGAGMYTLVIHGVNASDQAGAEVGRYPFELKIEN